MRADARVPNTSRTNPDGICSASWLMRKSPIVFPESLETINIVDLFCGSGGLTLGAFEACRQIGKRPVIKLAVDLDIDSLEVYRENFCVDSSIARLMNIENLCKRTLKAQESDKELSLKTELGPVDILLAGPPCQGHSDLNNSTRRDDPRNRLYLHAVRMVKLLRPTLVIIENVPAIRHDTRKVLDESIRFLRSLGYHVQDPMIDMSNLGLAQQRKRLVLIATKDSVAPYQVPELSSKMPISAVLKDLVDKTSKNPSIDIFDSPPQLTEENRKRIRYLFRYNLYDLPNKLRPPCHRFKKHSYVSMYGRLRWDQPSQTITSGFGSPGQGRYIHPLRERLITAHEAARIQGFPDFFSFKSVTKKVKLREMIANAVPPVLSASIIFQYCDRSNRMKST